MAAYYKWTQWIFLQLFKKGLAYKATMPVNWCTSCKCVLVRPGGEHHDVVPGGGLEGDLRAGGAADPVALLDLHDEVAAYQKAAASKSDLERTELNKEKTGVKLDGVKGVNPVNGPVVVGGDGHDGPGAVGGQHVVGDEDGDLLPVHGVDALHAAIWTTWTSSSG